MGNVGDEYNATRHNIGFEIADAFASSAGAFFATERLAFKTEIKHKGRIIVLIKPTTFMNLSGKAINYWLQQEKIPVEHLLVLTDDLALPFGSIRLRAKGSAGGHNGLKSISETLLTDHFARARFGVGNDFGKNNQVAYVLGKWNNEEQKLLTERIAVAVDLIKSFVTAGVALTMNTYNNK